MGCAQSRIDNEESVCRCKDRKNLMKEAVIARNAFAASQSGYAVALKNTGAALSDYGLGESEGNPELHQPPVDTTSQPQPPPPPPIDNLPPPPPPLPNFSPSPIQRATTMPAIPLKSQRTGRTMDPISIVDEEDEERGRVGKRLDVKSLRKGVGEVGSEAVRSSPPRTPDMKGVPPMPESKEMAWDYFFMMDNMPGPSLVEEEEDVDNNDESTTMGYGESEHVVRNGGHLDDEMEPKTPENMEKIVHQEKEDAVESARHIEHSKTAPPEFRRVKIAPSITLMQILGALDDHFLRASECAKEVSKQLEATRLHYHSNFADNRGHIDHSARVMRVITWNRSFRGVSSGEGGKEDLDSEEYETHATILDKLMAWEKKLYDEVKQGELMKLEYQKKIALLNRQKKHGASVEYLEKTKAAVSHLHTRYIVDMQSMDSTVSEVNHIRDEQLYPKLVALVNEMATSWQNMCNHHVSQLKIVEEFKALDVVQAPKETTKHHHGRTIQLLNVVHEWHSQFDKLVTQQKHYIRALNNWLKLNLIPIESSLKEQISSPPMVHNPPIQPLLHSWHDYLEKLPDDIAKSSISSFAAVIDTIRLHQEEEMKLKDKCEETRKEYFRKKQAFEEWHQKYVQRRGTNATDHERGEEANPNDTVSEKQFAVESLKKRLEENAESYQRHCVQVREKSLGNLKTRLPELFRAMSDYSHACANAYERLKFINQPQSAS